MTMDLAINALVTITLIEMMAAIGLRVAFGELLAVARNWRLVARAALANYICVPAVTSGLLLLYHPHPMVAAGFLILAVCPGAPYGPACSAIAKGNVAAAVGLMVLLAGSSAIVAPLMLRALLPLVSQGDPPRVDSVKIALTLLITQLLPLCAGVAVRQWGPALAERLQKPADMVSKLLNLAAVGLILVAQFPLLLEIRPRGFVGMLILLAASWAAGWVLGGRDAAIKRTMTLTTSLRNIGVSLVVATGTFADTPAVTAVAAYGLVSLFGTLALALLISAFASRVSRAAGASHQ